ncbi:hypothetical protein FGO68_gene15660 [Halteria grandinella]|uniref:Uncharacterized protein n=1 Tax=Halteria grandinella TaxID=5974 RepID=A0A8J8NK72_HALGN|nr:hypothetical protein FGO68_gene15660 [Halteria grandinella]
MPKLVFEKCNNQQMESLESELKRLRQEAEQKDQLISRFEGKIRELPITFRQLFEPGRTSGSYFIKLSGDKVAQLYFLIEGEGKVWMRGQSKIGQNIKKANECSSQWTKSDVKMLPKIADVGWSESLESLTGQRTWFLQNASFKVSQTISDGQYSYKSWSFSKCLANLLNGETPDGQGWSIGYFQGYLFIEGLFATRGSWDKMATGTKNPGWTTHYQVGQSYSLRTGGHYNHTGEFIHSTCNGYNTECNSITSRIGWGDTKVVWYRLELQPQADGK